LINGGCLYYPFGPLDEVLADALLQPLELERELANSAAAKADLEASERGDNRLELSMIRKNKRAKRTDLVSDGRLAGGIEDGLLEDADVLVVE